MDNKTWYDTFIKTIHQKFPKKADLMQALMDLLIIEREAVYRRLRKDVIFSSNEIVKIATAWNISIDNIIGVNSGITSFQMLHLNYLDPSKEEMAYLREVIHGMYTISKFPDTEFMFICNKLPRPFVAGYKYLNQFYLFKWLYQYGNKQETMPFSKIVVSPQNEEMTSDYFEAVKHVPSTSYIFDNKLFDTLVSDIKNFCSIRLITEEEKNLIQGDLASLLNYMLFIANNGYYPETKQKVNLYISQLNIDTNYSYTYSQQTHISFIHVFEKFDIYTYSPQMTKQFKGWMQLKKKSSIQISEVDERSRIEYFAYQQKLIDSLV